MQTAAQRRRPKSSAGTADRRARADHLASGQEVRDGPGAQRRCATRLPPASTTAVFIAQPRDSAFASALLVMCRAVSRLTVSISMQPSESAYANYRLVTSIGVAGRQANYRSITSM